MFAFTLIKLYYTNMKAEQFITIKPGQYSVLYVDMNSFFASVEQFYNPALRRRPVAVSTSPVGGSIIAASIEAKLYGIKTGTRVGQAIAMCPQLVVVGDRPELYRTAHRQIMKILHSTVCHVQAKSIDEAYLKVPSYMQSRDQVIELVESIKASLHSIYGSSVLCSVGVSHNVWLAKMAGNSQKPNGLVFVSSDDLASFYGGQVLTDFTGISTAMAKRLYQIGIETPLQLYSASWRLLNSKLGVNGGKWYLRMRGFEVDIRADRPNKSIGHQVTTAPSLAGTVGEITTYINKMSTTLGSRLRSKSLAASGLALYIRFDNGEWWASSFKKTSMFRSNSEILALLKMLLEKLTFMPSPASRIGVTLLNLAADRQITMAIAGYDGKNLSLSIAMDEINHRYGPNTIMPLRSHSASHIRLDRVGFAGDIIREQPSLKAADNYL